MKTTIYFSIFLSCLSNVFCKEKCLNEGSLNKNTGLCQCSVGFEGVNCQTKSCANGSRMKPGSACICERGWKGKLCNLLSCADGTRFNKTHCTCHSTNHQPMCGQALCKMDKSNGTENDDCFCETNLPETFCDILDCAGGVKNDFGGCKCYIGSHLQLCNNEIPNLARVCSEGYEDGNCHNVNCSHGNRTELRCSCHPGWQGAFCDELRVRCVHGHLINGTFCSCNQDFEGPHCDIIDYTRVYGYFGPLIAIILIVITCCCLRKCIRQRLFLRWSNHRNEPPVSSTPFGWTYNPVPQQMPVNPAIQSQPPSAPRITESEPPPSYDKAIGLM